MTDQPLEWVFTWGPSDAPAFTATYRKLPGKEVWRMADCRINGPVQQKITGARVREILNDAGRGERHATRLVKKLAAAIEEVRRRAGLALLIKNALGSGKRRQNNQDRRAVDALATLRRSLRSMSISWEPVVGSEDFRVANARALLFLLDRVRTEPPPRLEEPWHAAAIDLAGIYVGAFGDPTTSWYSKGRGVRFVCEALKVLAGANGEPKTTHDPETIRKVIEGAKPLKAVSSTG